MTKTNQKNQNTGIYTRALSVFFVDRMKKLRQDNILQSLTIQASVIGSRNMPVKGILCKGERYD